MSYICFVTNLHNMINVFVANVNQDNLHKTIFHTETFVWGYLRSCDFVQANETKPEGRCGDGKKRHDADRQLYA